VDEVYHLAASAGGGAFLRDRLVGLLNVAHSTQVLLAANEVGVRRVLFAGSAILSIGDMYRDRGPENTNFHPVPNGYMTEKFFSEQLWHAMGESERIETRIARINHVYGPGRGIGGTGEGVSTAMCRKAIESIRRGDHEIEIWGDGKQRRAFTFITDAVEGIERVMRLDHGDPVMVSSRGTTSIDELVDVIESIAGVRFQRRYVVDECPAVARHQLDHDAAEAALGWEPSVGIAEGIRQTYEWVRDQIDSSSARA
jgi:nucleoside-diphosphate-sugar epimerase